MSGRFLISITARIAQHAARRLVVPYRCYFLDQDRHIEAVEIIEAPTVDAAIARAEELTGSRNHPGSFELWNKAAMVFPGLP